MPSARSAFLACPTLDALLVLYHTLSDIVRARGWKNDEGEAADRARQRRRKGRKKTIATLAALVPSLFSPSLSLFFYSKQHSQAPQLLQRVARAFSAQAAPAGKRVGKRLYCPLFLASLLLQLLTLSLPSLFNFYQKQRRRFRSRRLGHRPGLVPRAAEADPRADGGDEGKEGVSSSWPDEGRGGREREEENDDDDDDRRNKPRLATPTPLSNSLPLSKKKKKTQKRNSRSPSRSPATPPPSRSSPPTSRPSSARPGSPTRPSSRPPWFPSGSRPRAATCARRSRR